MRLSPWDLPLLCDANQYSNFQSFLSSVTPTLSVSSNNLQARKAILNGVPKPLSQEIVDSFSLSSLWDFYTDPSLYGIGVPILLNTGESILQYYSPSLSALQIYTHNPASPLRLGKSGVGKQGKSEERKNDEFIVSLSNNSSKSSELASDDSIADPDVSCHTSNHFGELYCEYNETMSPYQRIPLSGKINELALKYPGLVKFHSTDLSPYSWFAIAWYPIYQVPLTKNVKELSACFVTYHSLSSFKIGGANWSSKDGGNPALGDCFWPKKGGVSVPPFAVVTYKSGGGEVWTNPARLDKERMASALDSATSWLKRLNFTHHDFNFFISRRTFS